MKRSIITSVAITLCVGYGVLSWDIVTHSQPPDPETSQFSDRCDTACCIDYNEALEAVKLDWQKNLNALVDQEKAASEMVEDGYESLRTYNCWVEYICRAVQFSGHAPIESALGTGLKEEHLGTVPGCQSPDNLRMESEYNQFVKDLKEVPLVGLPVTAGEAIVDAFGDIMIENKINFFPRCQTSGSNNRSPDIAKVKAQYDNCKREIEVESTNAFVFLETILKKTHGNQKAAALENKLGTIVTKLHGMEAHVGYLSNFLEQLDSRFSCYAGKCS